MNKHTSFADKEQTDLCTQCDHECDNRMYLKIYTQDDPYNMEQLSSLCSKPCGIKTEVGDPIGTTHTDEQSLEETSQSHCEVTSASQWDTSLSPDQLPIALDTDPESIIPLLRGGGSTDLGQGQASEQAGWYGKTIPCQTLADQI